MNREESTQSFDWVYYVLGIVAGILVAAVATGSFLSSILGGIIGLIIAALFLNKIVKGRTY
jgi:L-lactate permease